MSDSVQQAVGIASLLLFVALAAAFFIVLRRAARVVAVNREDEGFRRDGAVLTDRAAVCITETSRLIDRVRRHQDPPSTLGEALPRCVASLERLRSDVDRLQAPVTLAPLRGLIGEEIDRAVRALEMAAYGCDLSDGMGGRARELEGQTSIKRGYLNLVHAREALMTLGIDLRSGRVDARRWFTDRPPAT